MKQEKILRLIHKRKSVKDTEMSRGYTVKPTWISMIPGNIPLSVNMDTLRASVSNKSKLQMFLRKGVIENAENTCPEEVETVFICFCAHFHVNH